MYGSVNAPFRNTGQSAANQLQQYAENSQNVAQDKAPGLISEATRLADRLSAMVEFITNIGDKLLGYGPPNGLAGTQGTAPAPVDSMERALERAHGHLHQLDAQIRRIESRL